MLKVDHISVMNLENAIRGARNPRSSWARSDSCYNETGEYVLGENDLSLAGRLCRAERSPEIHPPNPGAPWISLPPCTGGRSLTPIK